MLILNKNCFLRDKKNREIPGFFSIEEVSGKADKLAESAVAEF